MTNWTDTGALVRLQAAKRRERSVGREWLLLALALGALIVSGCSGLLARPAPMSEYSCAGWRTLESGASECMMVERTVR